MLVASHPTNSFNVRITITISEGEIPLEHVQYELSDHVVASLRNMPEYKLLVCNWDAMLRALQNEQRRKSTDQRSDTVNQRVILRMLVTSAKLEVSDVDSNEVAALDPDLLFVRQQEQDKLKAKTEKKNKAAKTANAIASPHAELTVALLRALPDLLTSFKSEIPVLQSLTSLPQYLCKLVSVV
jgi:ABC-type antimicrobial peptide transport system ATPase subunit